MRVLGVDPGTIRTGWGVVECAGSKFSCVESGVIAAGRAEIGPRLARILEQLSVVVDTFQPDVLSLERNFLAHNVQSAFRIGEARGVILAVGASRSLVIHEYTPAEIKKAVVGYGRAQKTQMQETVQRLLSLSAMPAEDAADALAAALCHGVVGPSRERIAAAAAAAPKPRAGVSKARDAAALPKRWADFRP